MSVATSIPQTARRGRSHRSIIVVVALAAVVAVIAWAIATYAVGSGGRPASPTLSGLTPQARQYVLGILALTPAQVRAAFGTDLPSSGNSPSASPTPQERRYAHAIASMSRSEQAAAFGTGK